MPTSNSHTILIGIGNSFRRDDGVGLCIVDKLNTFALGSGIETLTVSGEGAELMASWQGYRNVYLFDAIMAKGVPGTIHRLLANDRNIPSDFFKYSSHAFSLAEAVELARVLERLPEKLVIYGVEGEDFRYGEGLSNAVGAAVDTLVSQVLNELVPVSINT